MNQQFSVLMSLYIKEKVEYARACFESLLRQTVQANEWVIVEDGPLTDEMYALLSEYQENYPSLINRVLLTTNQGLGNALREGILHCKYNLIARMDTDDIAREDRFEKQLNLFAADPLLDICGSHIKEFDGTIDNIISERKVPVTDADIKQYQKRRDSFNHMTVMYKKEAVLKAGNYQHAMLMEDTLLWVNMILSAAKCANVDDYLVFVRTGSDMFDRRGGWSYFKKYKSGRKRIYETGYISWWDYEWTLIVQFIVAIIPNSCRRMIYKKLLRKC
jgi:glycosyltransferase involved in cell wall biosynthesis